MQLPKFGSIEEETVKGDSSVIAETVYSSGKPTAHYRHYTYRVRVTSTQEEKVEHGLFMMEKQGMLKSSFHTETTKDGDANGYWYIVKKWSQKVD